MGRYYWSKKDVVEDTRTIDINWLMKTGQYKEGNNYYGRSITWTRSGAWGESKNSISYSMIMLNRGDQLMNLSYVVTDRETEEKIDKDYSVHLVKTLCNFGGFRYWFICPNTNCNRRVGKLYFGQKLFLCRHCLNLSYDSKNDNKRFREIGKMFDYEKKQEKLSEKLWGKHGRKFYMGRPTKTYRKYLRYGQLANSNAGRWLMLNKLTSRKL